MRPLPTIAVVLAGLSSSGCSDEGGISGPPGSGVLPMGCQPGEWQREDGTCVAAGLPPDLPCPPGEWMRDSDGSCIPAGVPPDGCAAGFLHDGDRGCEPVLPPEPCPSGLMAVPGDPRCREIATCGTGTWGDLAVEPNAQHVDQAYAGVDSDGSAQKPWSTIGDALAAAAPDAIVAIAAGTYAEDVVVQAKTVRLWGRCPQMVDIVGTGAVAGGVFIGAGSGGTQVAGLAVSGVAAGVVVSGSQEVEIDRIWAHDNAGSGIVVDGALGVTSVTLRASLVEQNHDSGVLVVGSDATVDGTVVRGTLPNAQGSNGNGVTVAAGPKQPATLTLRASVVEHNQEHGVFVQGSEALLDATVVRGTLPTSAGFFGRGVNAQGHPATGAPSKLTLVGSLIEDNAELAMYVAGSEAVVDSTVLRGGRSRAGGAGGVAAQRDASTGAASTLTLRSSLVDQNRVTGVFVRGSAAIVENTAIRDTQRSQGIYGYGLAAQVDATVGASSTLTLSRSVIERSGDSGLLVFGSEAHVEATLVRGGFSGRGVSVEADVGAGPPSSLTMSATLIEESKGVGLLVTDSTATVEASTIRGSEPTAEQAFGDGIVAASLETSTAVTVTGSRIEQSARAALATFGATLAVGECALECQTFDLFAVDQGTFAFMLADLGGNVCGCPDAVTACAATGEGLMPPPPIGGLE